MPYEKIMITPKALALVDENPETKMELKNIVHAFRSGIRAMPAFEDLYYWIGLDDSIRIYAASERYECVREYVIYEE